VIHLGLCVAVSASDQGTPLETLPPHPGPHSDVMRWFSQFGSLFFREERLTPDAEQGAPAVAHHRFF
jgi:hypothetical protein